MFDESEGEVGFESGLRAFLWTEAKTEREREVSSGQEKSREEKLTSLLVNIFAKSETFLKETSKYRTGEESARNSKLTREVWTSVAGSQKRRISCLSSVGRRGSGEETGSKRERLLSERESTAKGEMRRREEEEGREEGAAISTKFGG